MKKPEHVAPSTADTEPRGHALLGTILFTLTVPATIIVWIPYLLTAWRMQPPFLGIAATRVPGVALMVLAAPLFFRFLAGFVREGHGTPAPIAPPEHLVVGGPFQRTRNPGYVAVVSLVAGQALLLGSWPVLVYTALLAVVFHLFVVGYEEPTLRRQFGAEYEAYCVAVPRWVPRLRAPHRDRG
jgi:protein-S-isoprenylcysteine O-methyltransferase Ste14